MFLGMNPGPWGMAQTGVPFGEVGMVKNFLQVSGQTRSPTKEHPKRRIEGLDCKRSEVSGFRFWNFVKMLCSSPDQFTSRCLVYNLCPLYFVAQSGRNIPLNELQLEVRKQLLSRCGDSLVEVLDLFGVQDVVCLGRFVESQVKAIVKRLNLSVRVHFLVHPSPASPMANSGWDKIAIKTFQEIGLLQLISPTSQPHPN